MSMKEKQAEMRAAMLKPSEPDPASTSEGGDPKKIRTAPGQMMAFTVQLKDRDQTIQSLESKLQEFKGSIATKKMETALIDESQWANRHATSFTTPAFESLREEILAAGGNIQPILVRPKGERYELVFGHRRFAACKQLGLPVLAMIMELSDEELFTMMDRENRERVDLSPYEQGEMWRRAVDGGLFPSINKLASQIGISQSHVTRCIQIARLPQFVLDLFESPTLIQVRWAKVIADELQRDPETLADRAQSIKSLGKSLGAAKTFEMLVSDVPNQSTSQSSPLKLDGKVVGKFQRSANGETVLSIKPGFLSDKAFAELQEKLTQLLGK